MTQQEIVQNDFQAQAAILDAERSYIRSQIALLEAQLKQNAVKGQNLEFNWTKFVEAQKAAAEKEQAGQRELVASETATGKTKKAQAKA